VQAHYAPSTWKRTWIIQVDVAPLPRDDMVRVVLVATRAPRDE
jgi:hypothetical protein